jgi:signal transduction histidine kinase
MRRPDRFLWPWRERILAGALAIAAVVGFVAVRHATDDAARRQAQQHAQLVALQVESNAARAVAYVDAIRGYLVSHPTVSEAGFSSFALGILGLAGLHEAAWVEPVAGARRARYEASVGRPITEPSGRPLGRAPAGGLYYPATLITQVLSGDVPGVDLGAYPRLRSVLAGSEALFAVVATEPAELPGGTGVFFATAAPRYEQRGRVPGFVVVSAPLDWLEGSFAGTPGGVEIRVGGASVEALKSGRGAIRQSFPAAARRWSVLVPGGRPSSTADALAWSLLGGGLALAALTLLLGAKRGQAEEERRAQLWFLESLDRINRAIQSTSDFEQMLGAVLDVVLAIFNCDRAWLAYPCDPEVTSLRVLLQRTRQQGLAALALDAEIPKDPELAGVVRDVLASDSPVRFDPDSRHASPSLLRDLFSVRSMIAMAVYPKRDKPYMFALHQCSHTRIWTPQEERLFQEIGRRLADALDPVLMFRDLRESERKIEKSRAEVEGLAEEQAALRRVATLVGQGAAPSAVFDAVAAEMAALLNADGITLCRYEPGEELTVLAHLGPEARRLPAGKRVRHDGKSVSATVRRTHRPARMDSYADTHGHIGEVIDELRFRSGVGTPIVVEGRLWGTAIANWTGEERPPEDTEERMAKFTQLLETAIANADSHDQLTASRARLVTEADEARRRVVRDLHDGAQQRLVHTIIRLKLAHRALRNGSDDAESLVGDALAAAEQGNEELRELAHGILPGALTQGGLQAGVAAVVARLELPVEVDVTAERFPAAIEASAYFVVAEALTNVVKHAHATRAAVIGTMQDGMLHVEVRDDGIGGVDPDGHGLVGMGDRVTALGGTLQIESPPGGGTLLAATLPLEDGVR